MKLLELVEAITRRDFLKGAVGLVAFTLASGVANGQEVKAKFVWSDPYDTANDAATASVVACAKQSISNEFCSAIFQYDGKFYYTMPQTGGSDYALDNIRIVFPSKGTFIAVAHTHPSGRNMDDTSPQFSAGDITFAKKTKVPLYMYSFRSGEVRVFIPGKSKVLSRENGPNSHGLGDIKYADGELVTKLT